MQGLVNIFFFLIPKLSNTRQTTIELYKRQQNKFSSTLNNWM